MPKKNELEFANFLLKFGLEQNLLDYVEEIVIPAFMSGGERSYGDTKFFFHDVEILNLGNEQQPILCIVGRYIKDTVVTREQVFNQETDDLIKDNESLHTSPSAVFMVILNNHRLMYFGETSYAPSLQSFQATTSKFLKEKYHDFVHQLYQQSHHTGVTKKQLYEQYYPPSLQIVSLSSDSSIRQFIDKYSLLKRVEIKLLTPNNDLDNNDLFSEARKAKEEAFANTTTIIHDNARDGLFKNAIIRQLESVLGLGNSQVKVKGTDSQGNRLEGSNDNFKLKTLLSDVPHTIQGIASTSYQILQNLIGEGLIRRGENRDNNISDKIQQLWNKIHNEP